MGLLVDAWNPSRVRASLSISSISLCDAFGVKSVKGCGDVPDQKEGNGNINMGFCAFQTRNVFTSENISSYWKREAVGDDRVGRANTYTDNGRVVWHGWRLVLLGGSRTLLDAQIFHIATSEDDEVVDLIRGRYLLGGIAFPTLGAV